MDKPYDSSSKISTVWSRHYGSLFPIQILNIKIFNTHVSFQSCNLRSTADICRSPRQHFLKQVYNALSVDDRGLVFLRTQSLWQFSACTDGFFVNVELCSQRIDILRTWQVDRWCLKGNTMLTDESIERAVSVTLSGYLLNLYMVESTNIWGKRSFENMVRNWLYSFSKPSSVEGGRY